jgi:hypothetical protein
MFDGLGLNSVFINPGVPERHGKLGEPCARRRWWDLLTDEGRKSGGGPSAGGESAKPTVQALNGRQRERGASCTANPKALGEAKRNANFIEIQLT